MTLILASDEMKSEKRASSNSMRTNNNRPLPSQCVGDAKDATSL